MEKRDTTISCVPASEVFSQGSLSKLSLQKLRPSTFYYTDASKRLMQSRGIIDMKEEVFHALERTIKSLLTIDESLSGGFFDVAFADKVIDFVNRGVIVFGTPILTNAGRPKSVTAACTVLPLRFKEGAFDVSHFRAESMSVFDNAIGTGYDLSALTHPAETVKELNGILDEINQTLIRDKKRPVASMVTLRADHPNIVPFIRAKRDADFSLWRCNISVFVTEELFKAASHGARWLLRDNDHVVVDSMPADALLHEIALSAHYCGEPGILFKDRLEKDNPTPHWHYASTAPCAEIAMAEGDACQFSYVNVASCVTAEGAFDDELFGVAVGCVTRLLDASVEHTIMQSDQLGLSLVKQKRRIGVGIMGFADLLIAMRLPYDHPGTTELATRISELLDYHSKRVSVKLAEERGCFPAFHESRYTDYTWVSRKLIHKTGVVSLAAWEQLFTDLKKYGIRHASTTALPPTGTSSTIVGVSPSLEPLFTLTDMRGNIIPSVRQALTKASGALLLDVYACLGSSWTYIEDEKILATVPYLRTARQIDPVKHIHMQSAFQKFLDESVAKTINLPCEATVQQVEEILWHAYYDGLKGITVFRDRCLMERSMTT